MNDLLVVRHAFTFLEWIHTTTTISRKWRPVLVDLMTPFVDAQRALVRNKGPNHVKVAQRLRDYKVSTLTQSHNIRRKLKAGYVVLE